MAANNNSQFGDRGHFSGEVSAHVVTQSRDSLIGAAVHFLRHPRVARATSSQLRTFLLQKGLTPDEVDESFHRALKHLNSAWSMVGFGSSFTALSPTMDKLLRRHSWLAVLYDISRVLLVLTGGGYLVFYIVQYYVIPWLTGQRLGYKASQSSSTLTSPPPPPAAAVAASAPDASCPQQLSAGRPAGESRRDQQQLVASEVSDLQRRLGQLSTEVNSLRSLLLSREQFPSLPAVPRPPALKSASTAAAALPPAAATVPSWQLVCRPAIGSDDETAAAATTTAAAADNGDTSCEADGCGEEQRERQQQQPTAAEEEQQQQQHEQRLLMSNKAGSSSSSAEIVVVSEHNSDELSDS